MSSNTMISLRPGNVVRQLSWSVDRKTALMMLVSLFGISLVAVLYLSQTSSVTETSYRIDELRTELDQVRNENAALSVEIARLEALSRIKARAVELGFRPAGDIRYLSVPELASVIEDEGPLRRYPVYNQPRPPLQPDSPSSLWERVLDRVAAWLDYR